MPDVRLVDNFGKVHAVPEADAPAIQRAHPDWRLQSEAEGVSSAASEAEAELYSGAGNAIDAYGARAWGAATAGGTDAVLGLLGGDQAKHRLRKLKEHQALASGAGEVVGGLTAAATGFGPIGEAATLGTRVAKAGEGAGVLARIGRAGAGAGIEGGVQGAGSAISEIVLAEDPLSVEQMGSLFSSRVLFGAATGAAAGSLAKSAELGLLKGKAALDDFASRQATRANVGDDLASLDAKGLRAAEAAERDALAQAQVGQKAASVDDINAYRNAVDEANPWAALTEGEESALLNKSNKAIRNLMNDPKGLAASPGTALKALRVQEQAFARAAENADDIAKRLANANAKIAKEVSLEISTLPDNLDSVVLSGKAAKRYGTFADVKVPKGGTVTANREEAARFLAALEAGQVTGEGQAALTKLPDLLTANRNLQAKIEASVVGKSDLTSKRLEDILAARDALQSGGGKSLAEQMAGGTAYGMAASAVGSIPLIGPLMAPLVGARAANLVSDKVFGRLGAAMGERSARTAKALGAVFEKGSRAMPYVAPVATRVLNSVAFAPEREEPPKGRKLREVYKARTQELREQVTTGVDGKPMVKPVVRARIADTLKPIGAMSPLLADKMETLAAARLAFLFSKMPKRPEIAGLPLGPDNWEPSEMEMRTWARYVAAAEDPDGVLERVAAGQVSPEDAETMRELYPEQLNAFTMQVLAKLPELRQTLRYDRRIALSVLTGVPVDPSMDPRILGALQAVYAAEPEPPTPKPAFGSVKNFEAGTPSQRREQGA